MKKTVYVLGNSEESLDQEAVRLIPELMKSFPHINFIHFDPTEEFPENTSDKLILMDTVIGLDKVTTFNNIDYWKLSPRVTVHDYDLPIMLGILKKIGKIRNITIIGIPYKGNFQKIISEVSKLFSQF